MPVEVVMPKLGLTMASGTIARWIKRPGERVREGEALVEVSTDKINYEVQSPASGTIATALGSDGEEFACGAVIGLIALAGEADMPALAAPVAAAAGNGVRVVASPAARRLARERGVPLAGVRGTGPRGRITLTDVPERTTETSVADSVTLRLSKGEPPSRLPVERRAIFHKMTEVGVLPLAQVETVVRVDAVRALIERRRDFRWTAYAVFAAARLLLTHPALRTDASSGAPFERIDIGVAAEGPRGLIVPVVRNADTCGLAAIEVEIVRLAGLARGGALTPDDVGGACFSISNVGPQGVERVSPLPDPPQTAILGIGAATQRPAVTEGILGAAWQMTCVVSFDHRFIDGAPAARFLADFGRACAEPGVLL